MISSLQLRSRPATAADAATVDALARRGRRVLGPPPGRSVTGTVILAEAGDAAEAVPVGVLMFRVGRTRRRLIANIHVVAAAVHPSLPAADALAVIAHLVRAVTAGFDDHGFVRADVPETEVDLRRLLVADGWVPMQPVVDATAVPYVWWAAPAAPPED